MYVFCVCMCNLLYVNYTLIKLIRKNSRFPAFLKSENLVIPGPPGKIRLEQFLPSNWGTIVLMSLEYFPDIKVESWSHCSSYTMPISLNPITCSSL